MDRNTTRWVAPLASLAVLGCDPRLPAPQGVAVSLDGGGGGGSDLLLVSVEPKAGLDAMPRVLRLHASLAGFSFDPGRMALVKGTLGTRQVDEFVEGKVSATLSKQVVPSLAWLEEGGEALAPEAPLDAGGVYTLVMADVPASLGLTVAATDTVPMLSRVWPPAGGSGTAGLGVWCGDQDAPEIDMAVVPAPAGLPGRIRKGVAGARARCLRFEASPGATDGGAVGAAVPPPEVAGVRLDPRPLEVDEAVAPVQAAACSGSEVAFGPGCVRVADDRLYGRSAGSPLLWAVGGAGTDTVMATAPGDPFVITGLPPSSSIVLDVTAVDAAGRVARAPFTAVTLPPEPHVVLNEVMAYPLGPRPAQEWVEIVNDGHAPASLGGYVLVAGSGTTTLPDAILVPGAFALIVSQSYSPSGGPDVAPAPGTPLLQVPHLGKEGLTIEGETFSLLDGGGTLVSSFPAKPRPKQGSSVARRTPSAPDALPGSFALAAPTPGWANAL